MNAKEADPLRFENITQDARNALAIAEIEGKPVQYLRSPARGWKPKDPSKPFHPQGIYRIAEGSGQ